jgi:hypothetical protein
MDVPAGTDRNRCAELLERLAAELHAGDGTAIRTRSEHLVGHDHRPFGVDDLADRGHEPVAVSVLGQEDDEVDRVGDKQVRCFQW